MTSEMFKAQEYENIVVNQSHYPDQMMELDLWLMDWLATTSLSTQQRTWHHLVFNFICGSWADQHIPELIIQMLKWSIDLIILDYLISWTSLLHLLLCNYVGILLERNPESALGCFDSLITTLEAFFVMRAWGWVVGGFSLCSCSSLFSVNTDHNFP